MSKKNSALPIYVISGKDKFLVASECDKLVDSLLGADEKAMGLLVADADKMEAADVFDELRTLPFLASRRVVVLKDADNYITNNRAILEKYFESPSPSGSLILCVSSWRTNTKLAKKVPKVGKHLAVGELKRRDLSRYAQDYAQSNCKQKIDAQTVNLIVELIGDDPGKICNEIDKLSIYVGDSNAITLKHVRELTANNREFDIFGVIDAMTAGDSEKSISKLRRMYASNKSAEFTSVGGFAFHFRRMFNAKVLQNKRMPAQQIANTLRIFGDRNNYFNQLTRWSLPQISKVIQALARIDFESKTGQTNIPTAIEQLVLKVSIKQSRR